MNNTTQLTRAERRVMRWGGAKKRLHLLLSAFDESGTCIARLPEPEYLRQIEHAADLLAAARPERKYRRARAPLGMEDHYGYLYRLFRFRRELEAGRMMEASYELCDLIVETGAAVFQPRVLYAILGTVTPTVIKRLKEGISDETALEDHQGHGTGAGASNA